MPDDDPKLAVSVGNVNVGQAIVGATPRKSGRQMLIEMTPLLSVLITAIALITSSSIQVWQNRADAVRKLDSDWRTALEKVSAENKDALVGTLEMQSFAGVKYEPQARSIAAALLPRISDPSEFDVAFSMMILETDSHNQVDLVGIARSLTNNLGDLYESSKKPWAGKPVPPADTTFENFVAHPELFFDEETHSEQLKHTLADIWKLDSATKALSSLWRGTLPKDRHPDRVTPERMDLSGITFLNGDFTGVDFRRAPLDSTEFLGNCTVTSGLLPPGAKVQCPAAPQKKVAGAF